MSTLTLNSRMKSIEIPRYRNVEIPVTDSLLIDKIKQACRYMHLPFETSACYNMVHFEIKCTEDEAERINEIIDSFYFAQHFNSTHSTSMWDTLNNMKGVTTNA